MTDFDKQVERNLEGRELEKAFKIPEAIKLYEANIQEDFDGSFPYRRLAILYRKKGLQSEEIRVLEKAILVFKSVSDNGRSDGLKKLQEFKTRLNKLKV